MTTPTERRAHRAGEVSRPAKPAPTLIERTAELMRDDHNLSIKGARDRVLAAHPELAER